MKELKIDSFLICMKFLDPVSLSKIANLKLIAKYVIDGLLSGLHTSMHKGHSLEFASHREYSIGDEIRYIDWKIFGRTDKYFIKQYQDETNLRAYILLDASGSMGFASDGNLNKLTYSIYLAASLSYLLLLQQDGVSLGIFDKELKVFIPPRHHISHLMFLLEHLEKIEPGGETSLSDVLISLGRYLNRRGLIIIISDLLDEPDSVVQSIKYLGIKHNEIIVFHIIDPQEKDFNFIGKNEFYDLETGEKLVVDTDIIRDKYCMVFNKFIEQYKIVLSKHRIDYFPILTSTPFEVALGQYLKTRK